jgi:hypothetical protein
VEQASRALDVAEEEGDRSGGQTHCGRHSAVPRGRGFASHVFGDCPHELARQDMATATKV